MSRSRRKSKRQKRHQVNNDSLSLFDDSYEMLSCKSKNRYESYWQAKFAADEQMQRDHHLKLNIYECQFCNGWHLTSQ